jgi:P-type Ca2+ transporter type 2C
MELFIDASTSFAFEREPEEPDLMQRPPRNPGAPLLPSGILILLAGAGSFSAVAALWLMLTHPGPAEHVRWLAYSALVAAQVVRAYGNRSIRTPVHRIGPNRLLLVGAVLVLAVQYAIPFIPGVSDAFRASPLDLEEWLLVAAIALAPALVAEIVRTLRHDTWVA